MVLVLVIMLKFNILNAVSMYDLQANLERVVRLASTTLHSEFGQGAAPTGLLFNDFRTPWDLSLASQIDTRGLRIFVTCQSPI